MITIVKKEKGQLVPINQIEPGCWVNIYPPFDQKEMEVFCHEWDIPSDFLTDSLDIEERARYDKEGDNELIVLSTSLKNPKNTYGEPFFMNGPIGIISKPDFIITISAYINPVIDAFMNGRVKNFNPADQNLFALQIFERNVYYFLQHLKEINQLILRFEKDLYESSRNKELTQLLNLQKCLVYFVTSLRNNEFMMTKIHRTDFLKLEGDEDKKELFQDIIVDSQQALETSNIYSNNLTNTLDTYGSIIGNNLNMVMRRLTSVTIILMVPTLITSFYGMNIGLPFQNSHLAYVLIAGLSLVLAAIMIFFFFRNKWF